MLRLAAVLTLCISPCVAEDWHPMTGDEIEATLNDQTLVYAGQDAWQLFKASGATLYNAGRDSWGYWRIQGDQYCSQWPPNAGWGCYDMETDGTDVRFVSPNGHITMGVLR